VSDCGRRLSGTRRAGGRPNKVKQLCVSFTEPFHTVHSDADLLNAITCPDMVYSSSFYAQKLSWTFERRHVDSTEHATMDLTNS
jgi:hypothetical protein